MRNGFMQKLAYKINSFMYGRNGIDELTLFLLILSFVITFLGYIPYCWFLLLFPLPINLYCLFRILSRNVYKRQAERHKFLSAVNKIKSFFRRRKRIFKERKTHSFFKCKKCRAVLRVPKGKGKIEITCPKCQSKLTKKT